MSDNPRSLLQRMDSLVEWTGIPRFARQEKRMRRLKWMPFLVLLMSASGLVLCFVPPHDPVWASMLQLWTSVLQGCAIAFSAAIVQLGPLRPKKHSELTDERDELWRTRSNLFAYATVSIVAMICLGGLGGYILWRDIVGMTNTSPEILGYRILSLAFTLFVLFMILPTLHASWTLPEIVEDEPEEEEGRLSFVKPRRR